MKILCHLLGHKGPLIGMFGSVQNFVISNHRSMLSPEQPGIDLVRRCSRCNAVYWRADPMEFISSAMAGVPLDGTMLFVRKCANGCMAGDLFARRRIDQSEFDTYIMTEIGCSFCGRKVTSLNIGTAVDIWDQANSFVKKEKAVAS